METRSFESPRARTLQECFTPDPREHRDPALLPCASERYLTKGDQHSVLLLGLLQVPRPKLFCQPWGGQCRVLVRVGKTSTPQLLPGQTGTHHEVSLPSSTDHVQVSVREESREIIPKMCQTAV